jgi:serine/threonine-protein kinase HipA
MTDQPPLGDLRRVEAADVWKGDRRAARLVRDRDDVLFSYYADYLAEPGEPVTRTLPVEAGTVRTTAGAVPPFFAGLLPEGARLRAVVVGTTTSEDDQLTLLLAVGADTIGDVRVVPAGLIPADPPVTISEPDVGSVRLADVFNRAVSPEPLALERVALPGVQPKVSAAMVSSPVVTSSGPAILKLNPERGFPKLVENEHFFLTMAADCDLNVPRHRLVRDRDGESGLLISRFDRYVRPDGVRRLPQEDGCQLLGAYPAAKYRLKTEAIAAAIAGAAEDGGGSALATLRRVLQLVAFSYVIGNGDLHAKNFSAARSVEQIWGASPSYDLVTTQPYLSWRDPTALDLYGRANRLDRSHLLESAARLGLPRRAATRMLDELVERAQPWPDRVSDIGLDERASELLAALLRRRLAELAE